MPPHFAVSHFAVSHFAVSHFAVYLYRDRDRVRVRVRVGVRVRVRVRDNYTTPRNGEVGNGEVGNGEMGNGEVACHPLKRVQIEKKLLCGAYRNSPVLFELQIWAVHSEGPSEQKLIKNFREKGAWAYPGTAQFFLGSPYYLRNGESYGFQI